jgi:hypothetical protein
MATRRIFLLILCTAVAFAWQVTDLFGQPGNPGGGGGPDGVPITGIEYLIGGGLAYGIRSLLKLRKKQSD